MFTEMLTTVTLGGLTQSQKKADDINGPVILHCWAYKRNGDDIPQVQAGVPKEHSKRTTAFPFPDNAFLQSEQQFNSDQWQVALGWCWVQR